MNGVRFTRGGQQGAFAHTGIDMAHTVVPKRDRQGIVQRAQIVARASGGAGERTVTQCRVHLDSPPPDRLVRCATQRTGPAPR